MIELARYHSNEAFEVILLESSFRPNISIFFSFFFWHKFAIHWRYAFDIICICAGGLTENDFILAAKINKLKMHHLLRHRPTP